MAHSALNSANNAGAERGFTLIEVLVALVVVAVGLVAVLQGGARSVADSVELRDKTFATWIGSNVVTEYQMAGAWDIDSGDDEREFANRTWPVEVAVREDPNPLLKGRVRLIEVTVFEPGQPDRNLRVVRGFVVNPALSQPAPTQ